MKQSLSETHPHFHRVYFVVVFLLICLNLRMSFSAADPLLGMLEHDLHLNLKDSGIFAVLPVMVLGVASPLGARLVDYTRPRMLILYSMCLALAGILWRSYGGMAGLYGGMVLIGLGLGVTGSVILGVVKQVFPHRVAWMMSGYTACVCMGTAVGSASSEPVALWLGGWRSGLAFWGISLAVVTLLWLFLAKSRSDGSSAYHTLKAPVTPLLKNKTAWMVSLFYLFRVASAYLLTIWMSSLMRRRGMDAVDSGFVMAFATVCQIPAALFSVWLIRISGGKSQLMFWAIPLSVISCWGLLFGPLHWWPLFACVFGLGIGAVFSIGMSLIVERAADEASTVALSGMSQGIGFICGGLLAWLGSLCVDRQHGDLLIAGLYTVYSMAGLYFGIKAARPGLVSVNGRYSDAEHPVVRNS